MTMLAQVAARDMTPPVGIALAGYCSRTRGSTAVADPLGAYALVLSDGHRSAAVVVLDVCSFSQATKDEMRKQALERAGVELDTVIISATHTHFGPVVDPDAPGLSEVLRKAASAEYRQRLIATVAELVAEAAAGLVPAKLKVGRASACGISFNRRPLTVEGVCSNRLRLPPEMAARASAKGCELAGEWRRGAYGGPRYGPPEADLDGLMPGVTDPEVVVLGVEAEDGEPLAAVVCFSCHPACGGPDFYAISADYPGAYRQVLRREIGAEALFLLGAAGDQVPSWREGDASIRVGQGLAGAAIKAWHCAEPVEGALCIGSVQAALPLRDFPPIEELEAALTAHEDTSAPEAWPDRYILDQARAHAGKKRLVTDVPAVTCGPWGLVAGPCEILAEIGLHIKQRAPTDYTMVVSMAGENLGYMPTDEAFREGGYEAGATALGPGAAPEFVSSALTALRTAHGCSGDER